jgi:hypothetical protein
MDDGTVHAYPYSKKSGQSHKRRVIQGGKKDLGEKKDAQPRDIDGPYDQFCDSSYEHQDSIVSVERNPSIANVFLTASCDGQVFV